MFTLENYILNVLLPLKSFWSVDQWWLCWPVMTLLTNNVIVYFYYFTTVVCFLKIHFQKLLMTYTNTIIYGIFNIINYLVFILAPIWRHPTYHDDWLEYLTITFTTSNEKCLFIIKIYSS